MKYRLRPLSEIFGVTTFRDPGPAVSVYPKKKKKTFAEKRKNTRNRCDRRYSGARAAMANYGRQNVPVSRAPMRFARRRSEIVKARAKPSPLKTGRKQYDAARMRSCLTVFRRDRTVEKLRERATSAETERQRARNDACRVFFTDKP